MAVHPRQAIRQAAAEALKYKTAADERVYTSREVRWKSVELPGIAVYTPDETSDELGEECLERVTSMGVVGVVSVTEAVDDTMDALALEMERAVGADPTLGGSASGLVLKATATRIADEQGRPVGAVELTYEVTYLTATVP